MEDICLQVRDMKISSHERDIARVDTYKTEVKSRQYIKNSPTRKYRTQQCYHCGSARVHSDMKDCPAYGKKCNKCRKSNHFAAVCKSNGQVQAPSDRRRRRRTYARRITDDRETAEQESDSVTSSDEEFLSRSVAHMTIKNVKRTYSLDKTVPITINDISIRAEPDSGADVNVMDEYQYSALKHRSFFISLKCKLVRDKMLVSTES